MCCIILVTPTASHFPSLEMKMARVGKCLQHTSIRRVGLSHVDFRGEGALRHVWLCGLLPAGISNMGRADGVGTCSGSGDRANDIVNCQCAFPLLQRMTRSLSSWEGTTCRAHTVCVSSQRENFSPVFPLIPFPSALLDSLHPNSSFPPPHLLTSHLPPHPSPSSIRHTPPFVITCHTSIYPTSISIQSSI